MISSKLDWNFQKIMQEIEELKKWKPKTKEEKASKYFCLKSYNDLLFARTINDQQLPDKKEIEKCLNWTMNYLDRKKSLRKNLTKTFDEQAQELLIEFMKLTQNNSLINTATNVNNPLIKNHLNQLTTENIIEIGNKVFNSIPFIENDKISKLISKDIITLTESYNTVYTNNTGRLFPTGHILCNYNENLYLNTLLNILHESAHNDNFNTINSYYEKELNISNFFSEFFPKLIELLGLDFIIKNYDSLDLDVNLCKFNFLNTQNKYLKNILSVMEKPGIALNNTNPAMSLLEMFGDNNTVISLPVNDSYNEKLYYEDIITYVEKELLASKSSTKFTELKKKINDPLSFIPPLLGGCTSKEYYSVEMANSILGSSKYLLSTLLAMKFYYIIKEDKEKGFTLLKEVMEELIINYKQSNSIIKKYKLEDFLTPDYIQQYTNDYNKENQVLKKSLVKNK